MLDNRRFVSHRPVSKIMLVTELSKRAWIQLVGAMDLDKGLFMICAAQTSGWKISPRVIKDKLDVTGV